MDREVVINGVNTLVVGVMPEGFGFPVASEAWVPLPAATVAETRPGLGSARLVGRLAPVGAGCHDWAPLAKLKLAGHSASGSSPSPLDGANWRRRHPVDTVGTAPSYTSSPSSNPQVVHVIVRDIQMSFGSMVVFILKWMFASIPAVIIMAVIMMIVTGVLGLVFGSTLVGLAGLLGG